MKSVLSILCFWTTSISKSGEFLVGVKGRLFKISGDFQVSEHDYVSCGSGEYHAVGMVDMYLELLL